MNVLIFYYICHCAICKKFLLFPCLLEYNFSMKVKELIEIIESDGWFLIRTKGSHRQFKHPTKNGTVTIAGKLSVDMPKGTIISVLKQAKIR